MEKSYDGATKKELIGRLVYQDGKAERLQTKVAEAFNELEAKFKCVEKDAKNGAKFLTASRAETEVVRVEAKKHYQSVRDLLKEKEELKTACDILTEESTTLRVSIDQLVCRNQLLTKASLGLLDIMNQV